MGQPSLASALGAALLTVYASSAHPAIDLSFGLYTSNKPTSMVKQFRPVLDAVENRIEAITGEPAKIRIQVARDYSQGIEHLASGKVDFSRFGPASYIEAKRANSGLRILAMERQDGDKVFYGIIAVAKDAGIHSIEDLRGKSFAFGSDQSTIGRYLSQLYLRGHGLYAPDLGRFDYLDRHDKVGTAVGAGHFDAGALNESTFNKLVAKGIEIRELARFPNVTKPWIARAGLPARTFSALQQALLELEDPAALKALKKDGFMLGDDSDYAAIRTAIENNGDFFVRGTQVAKPAPATPSADHADTDESEVDPDENQTATDATTATDPSATTPPDVASSTESTTASPPAADNERPTMVLPDEKLTADSPPGDGPMKDGAKSPVHPDPAPDAVQSSAPESLDDGGDGQRAAGRLTPVDTKAETGPLDSEASSSRLRLPPPPVPRVQPPDDAEARPGHVGPPWWPAG